MSFYTKKDLENIISKYIVQKPFYARKLLKKVRLRKYSPALYYQYGHFSTQKMRKLIPLLQEEAKRLGMPLRRRRYYKDVLHLYEKEREKEQEKKEISSKKIEEIERKKKIREQALKWQKQRERERRGKEEMEILLTPKERVEKLKEKFNIKQQLPQDLKGIQIKERRVYVAPPQPEEEKEEKPPSPPELPL
jgi:hypothetical protein